MIRAGEVTRYKRQLALSAVCSMAMGWRGREIGRPWEAPEVEVIELVDDFEGEKERRDGAVVWV